MKSDSLISIVIPIYNAEKYLEECIESVINQTYSNIEIILVNDGSTDRSAEICNTFAEMDFPWQDYLDKQFYKTTRKQKCYGLFLFSYKFNNFTSNLPFCLKYTKLQIFFYNFISSQKLQI